METVTNFKMIYHPCSNNRLNIHIRWKIKGINYQIDIPCGDNETWNKRKQNIEFILHEDTECWNKFIEATKAYLNTIYTESKFNPYESIGYKYLRIGLLQFIPELIRSYAKYLYNNTNYTL